MYYILGLIIVLFIVSILLIHRKSKKETDLENTMQESTSIVTTGEISMATYGFKVMDANGKLIISDTTPTYQLQSKHTVTLTKQTSGIYSSTVSLTAFKNKTKPPLVAFTSTTAISSALSWNNTNWVIQISSLTALNITFYVYGTSQDIPRTEKYGIEVYNAKGVKTFASYASQLKVLKLLKTSNGANPLQANTVTAGANKLAFCPLSMAGIACGSTNVPPLGAIIIQRGVRLSGNSVIEAPLSKVPNGFSAHSLVGQTQVLLVDLGNASL